jgi:hypothetical protein
MLTSITLNGIVESRPATELLAGTTLARYDVLDLGVGGMAQRLGDRPTSVAW